MPFSSPNLMPMTVNEERNAKSMSKKVKFHSELKKANEALGLEEGEIDYVSSEFSDENKLKSIRRIKNKLLMRNHPDNGGSIEESQKIDAAFKFIEQQAYNKDNHGYYDITIDQSDDEDDQTNNCSDDGDYISSEECDAGGQPTSERRAKRKDSSEDVHYQGNALLSNKKSRAGEVWWVGKPFYQVFENTGKVTDIVRSPGKLGKPGKGKFKVVPNRDVDPIPTQ